MYKSSLETYIKPLPEFGVVGFGGATWMRYREVQGWAVITDHYCLPLSGIYYLRISIEQRFEVTDRNRTILGPEMQRAADWILQRVKVSRSEDAAASLVLPPVK